MTQPDAPTMLAIREEENKDDLEGTAFHVAEILEDLRLAQSIEQALRSTGYLPLRAIQVVVCDRLVLLQGYVPSYYLKQMAQIAALNVTGVEQLRDDLEVLVGEPG